MIENPKEGVLNWLASMDPSRREILVASAALVVVIAIGTVGYTLLEGWPWIDGLYMTFITLSTIGFGEVRPLSPIGRFFTIFLALTGIGIVTFVAARSAQLLLASERLRERRMMKRIEQLTDHYIVCGYGRVGQRLAEDLRTSGRSFVVVDHSEEEIQELRESDMLYVKGNAEEEETLRAAGIERAFGLILALPEDSSNVFVTLTAREMNPNVFILARTMDHRNRTKMLNAGANKVIAPSEVGADRMAQVILRPNVDQFMERVLHASGALSLQIEEVEVHRGAPLAGQSLAESNFRQQFDAIVIGMIDQSEGGAMTFNPSPSDIIQEGDVLIVLGDPSMIRSLREDGCMP
jgi:voltage-gated potassium channel